MGTESKVNERKCHWWDHDWETVYYYSDGVSLLLSDKICLKCGYVVLEGAKEMIEAERKLVKELCRVKKERHAKAMAMWKEM